MMTRLTNVGGVIYHMLTIDNKGGGGGFSQLLKITDKRCKKSDTSSNQFKNSELKKKIKDHEKITELVKGQQCLSTSPCVCQLCLNKKLGDYLSRRGSRDTVQSVSV